ncbi:MULTISPECIES: hypothetical protein [Achromobacter]|uniref:hypothetical protein n=1 Tax=Achromobacter TaxID=222 RepID=UPI0023F9DE51|nr:hypothetical protein [Achromobacter anxifer]MDF8363315.1 hypothetical protein [Achromobacter anxifer]
MIQNINRLAQRIRLVDGSNKLGAAELAEALMPYLAEQIEADVARRVAHVQEALLWTATALTAVASEQKPIIINGRTRTIGEILDDAIATLSAEPGNEAGADAAQYEFDEAQERQDFEVWGQTGLPAGRLKRAPWPYENDYLWSSAQYAWGIWKTLRKRLGQIGFQDNTPPKAATREGSISVGVDHAELGAGEDESRLESGRKGFQA